ncbi:Ig-like domain-containing protein [Verminephrobacter aporrectodeae]|nr:Ig-like domain-containing protein [Verminephrobacter aporrectodeae]
MSIHLNITLANTRLKIGETTTVTFAFSEPVTGFTRDDIVLTDANGTLGPLTANADGKTWTATFTPTANVNVNVNDPTNTISVNLTGVTDDAGNAGVSTASSANYTVDTLRPTATITLADSALTVGETTTVTFAFSEPVTGFTRDVVLANGTLGAPTTHDNGRTWTATLTPTANVYAGANTIRVNLTGVTDVAGNAGTATASSANYTVDTRPANTAGPTATITLADTSLTVGETTTVTFAFSETVTDFTREDIVLTNANGMLGTLTANADGKTWTATFTPTDDIEDASNTIGVNLAGVRNAAGTAGTGSASSANYSIDTKRPYPTNLSIADTKLCAGESTTVTLTFSEALNRDSLALAHLGLTPDLTANPGTLSNLRTTDGITWQYTLTAPTSGASSTGNFLRMDMVFMTDVAGNRGQAGVVTFRDVLYDIDLVRPTATITLADNALTVGETTTVTFAFSEPVTGFTHDDIVLTDANGTLGPLTANADGKTWTATFTPTANVNDTTNTISVNLAGVTDTAGNAGVSTASSANYTVDTLRPTATITLADSVLTVGETTTVTFAFSEPVTGFTRDDVVLANGTLGDPTTHDNGRTWTATLTPTANVYAGANTIRVNLTGVTDVAGNTGTATASSANYTVDTRPANTAGPTATITLADTSLIVGETTAVTFTFSETVRGFTNDDVVLTDANGTLGTLTPNADGKTWTATFTPTVNIEDSSNTISVNLAGVTNAAGNAGTGSASSASYSIDTKRPFATDITIADTKLCAGESTTVTVTVSEALNQDRFTLDSLLVSRNFLVVTNPGTFSDLRTTDGITWQFTLTAPTSGTSSTGNYISTHGGYMTDVAGNAGRYAMIVFDDATFDIDLVRPTATITLADSALTIGETTTVTFAFSEPVTGFTIGDIVLTDANGTLGMLTANGKTWTATFTPTANVNDTTNTIRVNLTGVNDIAGNAGVGTASSSNYTVSTRSANTADPTVTITLADTSLTVGDTTTVTFAFSEAVRGFTNDDVVLTDANGTLGPLTANADGKTWTATFTPTNNIEDSSNTIGVNLAGVTNAAGTAGTGPATSANYSIDTKRPTPTSITIDDPKLCAGESTTVTLTFSEAINRNSLTLARLLGFTPDLTASSGTVSNLRTTDDITWQYTLTAPTTGASSTGNFLSVLTSAVTDVAGNTGQAGATYFDNVPYDIDLVRPTATITLTDNALTVGETTTVTFAFSEPVTGFTREDIVLTDANGTLGPLTANADGKTWTATLTPTANVNDATNTIRVNLTGVNDIAGNAGQGSASSGNYTVQTQRLTATITLADTSLIAGETTTVTIVFNETVTDFTRADIVLTDANGTLGDPTTNDNGKTWTATFTPTADVEDSSNTIGVNLAGVRNAAGTAGTGSASSTNYSIDTKRPVPTYITIADTKLCAGESTTVTLAFSEALNRDSFTLADLGFMSNASSNFGTLSDLRTTDGITWQFTLTAPTSGDSSTGQAIVFYMPGVTDVAGNMGPRMARYFTEAPYDIDLVRPTATITLADSALTVGETTTVTFAFSEPVTGFTHDDIVLTDANGTLGTLTANADGKTWTATFTPTTNVSDTTNTISINLAGVADTAGNAGVSSASSANYTVDTRPANTAGPTATITLADTSLIAGETTTVTIVFNETVTDFTRADIVLTDANGTLGDPTTNDNGKTWTATFTPTADVEDSSNTIGVNLAGARNAAGTAGTGSASSTNYSIDTKRPVPTYITIADTKLCAGESTTVTLAFSEALNRDSFTLADLGFMSNASSNFGTLSDLRTTDGITWQFTLTAPTSGDSSTGQAIVFYMPGVTDVAGNMGPRMARYFTEAPYDIDLVRPTATITLADTALTVGETTTVTFAFSEPVTGFTHDDIVLTDANGTLGTLTANADGKTWTATFTPTANVNDTTNTISVNLTGVTDTAGNAGVSTASSSNYTVDTRSADTTGPTATITLADTALTVGETTTVTIRFNEPVTGFANDDIVLTDANGTLSTLTPNADRTVWTATFTPTANVNDTTNTISVNLAGVTDTAGNAGVSTASSANYTVDTRPADTTGPTATITLADSALTVGETTTVTIRFNEPVTNFDASDIVLTDANGTLGTLTANADGKTWTATFTPTANVNDTTNTISVNLAGLTDTAGNAGVSTATSANYTVDTRPTDTTGPTATITLADSTLTVGETTAVTIRFNEPVTGFANDDIVLTDANGTLSTLTPNADRTVWTATFTPTANVNDTTNTISVNLTGVTDDAGNAGVGTASSANYTVATRPADTTGPTATITLADTALTVGETTTVTINFNEPVTNFDASDIVLTDANGTLGTLTANADGKTWTATFTPTANVNDTTNTISVNLAGLTDTAGNAGVSTATSANYTVDTRPTDTTGPTATITLADSTLTVGETTAVTIRFNEPVTGFANDDIVLTDANGTLSTLTPNADRTVWTATFTPTANVNDTTNTISVNLAGVTDTAGNAGVSTATSANYTVDTRPADTTGPTATITLADTALTVGETTTVTINFNEPVTNFDASDIVLTDANGTLGTLTANTDGKTWTATFTPTANVNDTTNTISVNLAGLTDTAGNAGVGTATSNNYTVDTRPADTTGPTATITLADTALTVGETTTVTIRFNEPVTGFANDDIILTDANGTLGTLTTNADGKTWTATFTPTANVNDTTNTISVNLAGVTDTAGNAGVSTASSDNYTVNTRSADTTGPTATITLADTALTVGETTTVTIRFNEPVTGFANDDIVLTDANGTLSTLTPNADRTVWTATFTPTANVNDTTNTISVNLAGVTDTAGNAGVSTATSANYTVDTRPADTTGPTATITLADTALTVGETTTVTIRFNEPVTNFDASDIVLTDANGTLGTLTANADGKTWTATFTPTANVNDTTNTISVNLAGLTDTAGNAGVSTATSDNYTVNTRSANTTGPTATITLADTALTVGETTAVTIRFNEPVTGFANDDIVLTDANGTLSTLTPNANRTVWTATFTPTANVNDTTNTISVHLTGLTDDAGNAGVSIATSANYTVDTRPDTTPPVINTATVSDNQLVLTYTEANRLDATHIPPTTALAVRVDNVLTAVTAITVNAQDKTVSLTLATAVSRDQAVTVAYNDPTTGDDANAIQDAAGNDAASFPAMSVNNRTPAPQSPAPADKAQSPAPADKDTTDKDIKDDKDTDGDSDGVPSSVEDLAPGIPGPAGAAPVAGDGNGDGVKDSTQAAVSSTSLVRSPAGESRPAGAASTHVTLVADSLDGKPNPGSSARITHLEQKNAPAELPKGMEMPLGLLRFEAAQATGHSSEKFSLYVDPALGVNGYWLRDSTGTWVNLASSPYGGKMALEGGQLRLDFEISDGGPFDADGKANGSITAPGAAAQMPLSIVGQAPDLAHGGFWF